MFYISYYTTHDDVRASSPAANAKTLSISKALAANGIRVTILSTCTVAKSGKGFVKGRRFSVDENVNCKQIPFFITGFGPFRRIQYILANIYLFFVLVFCTKKDENVLFYHAVERASVVALAQKIRRFRLILEVEEIYANASKLSPREIEAEKRDIACADAFIFPTVMLNGVVNTSGKPYAIIHGTYEVTAEYPDNSFNDDKIHVVYAGTLSRLKGGAYAAAEAALFLDSGYHIHILGFGSDADVSSISDTIKRVSVKTDCSVTYDGCFAGEKYERFIQNCHIGLSTQNPQADFNDTSFPSKIFTYMSNGLQVVSADIPVVRTSAVNDYINYYSEQTPEGIANAIKSVPATPSFDPRQVIDKLNTDFKNDIKTVIQEKT